MKEFTVYQNKKNKIHRSHSLANFAHSCHLQVSRMCKNLTLLPWHTLSENVPTRSELTAFSAHYI